MRVKKFVVGSLSSNCYLVICEKTENSIIIDPGFESNREANVIYTLIKDLSLNLKLVINTHGHPDHTFGNTLLQKKWDLPIYIHEFDANPKLNSFLNLSPFYKGNQAPTVSYTFVKDGEKLKFGTSMLTVIHTPGHTPGSISLHGGDFVFTGDTLFYGSIGRTDLPFSSSEDLFLSLQNLMKLPDKVRVYPGHGPTTQVGFEKRTNPFLQHLLL